MHGVEVWSLVRELRSHMPLSSDQKKKKKKNHLVIRPGAVSLMCLFRNSQHSILWASLNDVFENCILNPLWYGWDAGTDELMNKCYQAFLFHLSWTSSDLQKERHSVNEGPNNTSKELRGSNMTSINAYEEWKKNFFLRSKKETTKVS